MLNKLLIVPSYLSVTSYFDADLAGDFIDRQSINGYCTFVGDNLVT